MVLFSLILTIISLASFFPIFIFCATFLRFFFHVFPCSVPPLYHSLLDTSFLSLTSPFNSKIRQKPQSEYLWPLCLAFWTKVEGLTKIQICCKIINQWHKSFNTFSFVSLGCAVNGLNNTFPFSQKISRFAFTLLTQIFFKTVIYGPINFTYLEGKAKVFLM